MSNYFKTIFVPNPDGSNSTISINDSNTAFVHTYMGDDLTGDGTREFPFRSINKASQKSGIYYIVFRGVVNESFYWGNSIIGDDVNQIIIFANYNPWVTYLYNSSIDIFYGGGYNIIQMNKSLVSYLGSSWEDVQRGYGFFYNFNINSTDYDFNCEIINYTIKNLIVSNPNYRSFYCVNWIVSDNFQIDARTVDMVIFKNLILNSSTVVTYNGITITGLTYTNDSKNNMSMLKSALLASGMSQNSIDSMFFKDSFGNETCKVILEERNGGTSGNIFNKYADDGSIIDYSLNAASNNEAIYSSDIGGYVGFFKPSRIINSTGGNPISPSINVNLDGSDTTDDGTLLLNTNDQISFSTTQSQTWNRIKSTNTIVIPKGIQFNGIRVMSTDGSPFGYYFGKHQNLINPTGLQTTDTLLPNTFYKVCSTITDVYHAIIYNDNQYLPDYFFKTDDTTLTFSLLNSDSGTIVKQALASPLESIELIPYDDINTPSTYFPKFSCPLMGDVKLLFHKVGDNINKPVLFSEVTNDKIDYYQNWAISNADQEFATYAIDTDNYYYNLPSFNFVRIEINGHFNSDYNQ